MWVSHLQTEVALYMIHDEYVDLSQSIKDLLPINTLCVVLIKGLGLDPNKFK